MPDTSTHPGRIAYIAAKFPLPGETFVYREVREMRRRGWQIVTVSLNDAPPPTVELKDLFESRIVVYGAGLFDTLGNIVRELFSHPIRSINTLLTSFRDAIDPGEATNFLTRIKLPLQALAALGLARRLRKAGTKWIHCHFAHSPTTVGMYAARQLAIPFSFTGHANDLFQRRAILLRKLQRCAFVACISRWHQNWYQSITPDISTKCELIRCGVETGDWRPAESSTPSDRFRITTICRLVEKKGVDTLIEAFGDLNRRKVAAKLTVAGSGEEEGRLRGRAKMHSVEIEWLGDVDNSKIPLLLADSDVLALPCRPDAKGDQDGIPVVFIEAMACGVPVVSGDLPAIRELIDDGATGLLVPGGNVPALVEALAKLAGDPQLRKNLAAAGRQKVVAEFSLAANVDRLESRLKQAMNIP